MQKASQFDKRVKEVSLQTEKKEFKCMKFLR